MESIVAAIAFAIVGYSLGATKIVSQGNEALVERFGKYHRKLGPGLNFVVPFVDTIVMEDTVRQQVLDVKPQNVITRDNIYLEVDAVVFWKILDIEKSFYKIDDLQIALSNLITTTLRATIASMTLEETIASRNDMNQALLRQLDDTTADWGVKVLRVDIQTIKPPESVRMSMEEQRAAEIRKRAVILDAEGEQEAEILRAEGTRKSMQLIAEALGPHANSREILRYLVAKDYVDASYKLGESPNAKIVFVDPANSTEMFSDLIAESTGSDWEERPSNGSAS